MKKRKLIVMAALCLVFWLPTDTSRAHGQDKELILSMAEEPVFVYKNKKLTEPIGMLGPNGAAYLVKEGGSWYQVVSGEKQGYINKKHTVIGEKAWKRADKKCPKKAEMTGASTVFVYEDAECMGRVVGLAAKEDTFRVTGQTQKAVEVVTADQIEGYVPSEDVKIEPILTFAEDVDWTLYNDQDPAALGTYGSEEAYDRYQGITKEGAEREGQALSYTGSLGEEIVAYAMQFLGNPYVWGGTSLTEGTDCSGFTQQVYQHFGYRLPRTSFEQRSYGEEICKGWQEELAQPGDLVCYDGHVALYLGHGQMIHAASRKLGIIISQADYREILCVRRVLSQKRDPMDLDPASVQILQRIVEAEAGGEDLKGKTLVAHVILNRLQSNRFPNTVKEVVFANRQFSPVANGRYHQVTLSAETKRAVEMALQGNDGSQGALYFVARQYADPENMQWFDRNLTWLFQYGSHEFYK